MYVIPVLLAAIAAGTVQAVTGFGSGVILMLAFAYLFDMLTSAALTAGMCIWLNLALVYRYRAYIRPSAVVIPILVYATVSYLVIGIAASLNLGTLKIAYGVFLILLSAFFLLVPKDFRIKRVWYTAALCSTVSGICSGLFSVGGPMNALYFLSATDSHEEYIADSQCVALFTGTTALITRISKGMLPLRLVPLVALGALGLLIGKTVGLKISERIKGQHLKKIVYAYVGISGAIMILQQLI